MSEEATYPIYRISARWEQDGEHDDGYPKWSEGLPEGRIWNSTGGMDRMFREDQDLDELRRWAVEEWWVGYVENKLADKNVGEPEITVEFSHRETWCLSWFEHWTFDVGQTDAEALDSFQCYVDRYAHMQDFYPGDPPEGYQCLMGAEDRWRWTGAAPDGASDTRSEPPCRCEHCKAQGKIRIGH